MGQLVCVPSSTRDPKPSCANAAVSRGRACVPSSGNATPSRGRDSSRGIHQEHRLRSDGKEVVEAVRVRASYLGRLGVHEGKRANSHGKRSNSRSRPGSVDPQEAAVDESIPTTGGSQRRAASRSRTFQPVVECDASSSTVAGDSRDPDHPSSDGQCGCGSVGHNCDGAMDGGECTPIASDSPNLAGKDAFRRTYLQNLSYRGVWVPKPQRPPSSQTVTIFDWDDTLHCTTFTQGFERGSWGPPPPAVQQLLREIGRAVRGLLKAALQLGQTFIITNAQEGWVQWTTAKYMPELKPLLDHVEIISARSAHESSSPDDPMQWKERAFLALLEKLSSQAVINIICIGDQPAEMRAADKMGQALVRSRVKKVKVPEEPSPQELLAHLDTLTRRLPSIAGLGNDAKLRVGSKRASSRLGGA